MQKYWTRRDVLRTVAAAASAPVLAGHAASLPRVAIVGAGMAGVSTAWLLDGQCDVTLLEAGASIGGNVRSVSVNLDGHQFVVDIGAQYFHPGPYPLYTLLLAALGLYPPDAASTGSHAFPASITVAARGNPTPRFVSPIVPDRVWPIIAPANHDGLVAFATCFAAARARERRDESWSLTLGDWLPTLGLSRDQWEGMLLPWAASLFSGSIEQARELSARAAMIFAAKALPLNPLDPLLYYVLTPGMGEVLKRLLDQCSTVHVLTNAAVLEVTRDSAGAFELRCADGSVVAADDLVFASSGPATLQLLSGLPGCAAQIAALQNIEFHDARLALHTDPIYAPSHPMFWSFLNCSVQGQYCEASMWLANVLAGAPPATAAKLWKSWTTHRVQQPTQILHEASFKHMLPTPATLLGQSALRLLQGRDRIWFAGGYTRPYDAQETALRSGLSLALRLGPTSARVRALATDEPD
jgi:predicted NAD/FAD-binding protein